MSVSRGYKGDRAGQGYGRTLPKRRTCPDCGKKGVFGPTPTGFGLIRECQYCRQTWGEEKWQIEVERCNWCSLCGLSFNSVKELRNHDHPKDMDWDGRDFV